MGSRLEITEINIKSKEGLCKRGEYQYHKRKSLSSILDGTTRFKKYSYMSYKRHESEPGGQVPISYQLVSAFPQIVDNQWLFARQEIRQSQFDSCDYIQVPTQIGFTQSLKHEYSLNSVHVKKYKWPNDGISLGYI